MHNTTIPNILYCLQFFYLDTSILSILVKLQTFLQNWGDYTDMSQGVILYIMYASDVLLICWCGTQLTQHVRRNRLL